MWRQQLAQNLGPFALAFEQGRVLLNKRPHFGLSLPNHVLFEPTASGGRRNARILHVLHGQRSWRSGGAQRQFVLVLARPDIGRHGGRFRRDLRHFGSGRKRQLRASKLAAHLFRGEQLALRAGLDLVWHRHQLRGGSQCREPGAGSFVFFGRERRGLLLCTDTLDLELAVGLQIVPKLGDTLLDLRGLRLLLQPLDLQRHVFCLAGVIKAKGFLAGQWRGLYFFLGRRRLAGRTLQWLPQQVKLRPRRDRRLGCAKQLALGSRRRYSRCRRRGSGRLGRLRSLGASAERQVHEALHDCTGGAAVRCRFAQTLN